jgi:hypothetical protein
LIVGRTMFCHDMVTRPSTLDTPQAVISYDKLDTFVLCALKDIISDLYMISLAVIR